MLTASWDAASSSVTQPPPPQPEFEVLGVIGSGSFGRICKVRRVRDGTVMARKEIDYRKMREKERRQLVQEVNILRELDHPHIVRYYSRHVDRDNFTIYILMEYCANGDLATLIKQHREDNKRIPEDSIWCYLSQLVDALYECHIHYGERKGQPGAILHRDIKPDNVFLDAYNNVKLGDFGLSTTVPGCGEAAFAQTFVGTPFYMSPELVNETAYNEKSDIWALGCLIYELCTLEPPFRGNSHRQLHDNIRTARYAPVSTHYSKPLRALITRLLQINPANRPTAAELRDDPRIQATLRTKEHADALARREAALAATEADVARRETELARREHDVARREELTRAAEATLHDREAELRRIEATLRDLEVQLQSKERQLQEYVAAHQLAQQSQQSLQPMPLSQPLSMGDQPPANGLCDFAFKRTDGTTPTASNLPRPATSSRHSQSAGSRRTTPRSKPVLPNRYMPNKSPQRSSCTPTTRAIDSLASVMTTLDLSASPGVRPKVRPVTHSTSSVDSSNGSSSTNVLAARAAAQVAPRTRPFGALRRHTAPGPPAGAASPCDATMVDATMCMAPPPPPRFGPHSGIPQHSHSLSGGLGSGAFGAAGLGALTHMSRKTIAGGR